jgi:hypothetical protein
MKKIKVHFGKLISQYAYTLEEKMCIIDWMLQTGKEHTIQTGRWTVDGINKALLAYSANNFNGVFILTNYRIDLFDAVFARAVYGIDNVSLGSWRKKESIYPDKYRMLSFNIAGKGDLYQLVYNINTLFVGRFLKKEHHQPGRLDRTEAKMLSISIHTKGNGWIVSYSFDFIEYNYEGGWGKECSQNKEENIYEFLIRAYTWLKEQCEDDSFAPVIERI